VDILYPIYLYITKEDIIGLAIRSYEITEVVVNPTNVYLRLYVLINLKYIIVYES